MSEKTNKFLREVKVDWDEIERKVREHKKKKLKQAAILAACCVAVFAGLYIFFQVKTYSKYRVVDAVERSDTAAATFVQIQGNILKYSNDGAFYSDVRNNLIWNQTFEMQEPLMETCEDYVAFADKGGQQIYVLNTEGLQGTIETTMQIQDIQVAAQGTVAVLMKKEGAGYIALYNKEGVCLAEGALHIKNSGYPVTMALSADGKNLAVSILDVAEGSVKTTISFYNFGSAGQKEVDNLVASYSYAGSVIPELHYVDGNKMLAFGDGSIMIFDGNKKPEEKKTIKVEHDIKSVFYDDAYFGYVFADKENENQRTMVIYDTKGSEIMSAELGINYEQIYFMANHEICVQNEKQCEIYTLHGIRKFKTDVEKNLFYVLDRKGVRNYLFLLEGETQQIRCKFFSSAR